MRTIVVMVLAYLLKILNIGDNLGRIVVSSLLLISQQIVDKCGRCGPNCGRVAVTNS